MTTLFAVTFLILFVGLLVFVGVQQKLRHAPRRAVGARWDNASPRRRLRSAVMGDEAKVQRLVEYERRLNPAATQREAEQRAYRRWVEDQRR